MIKSMVNVKTQKDVDDVMNYLKSIMSKKRFQQVFKDTMSINQDKPESVVYDTIMGSLFNRIICNITPEMKEKIITEYKEYYVK